MTENVKVLLKIVREDPIITGSEEKSQKEQC